MFDARRLRAHRTLTATSFTTVAAVVAAGCLTGCSGSSSASDRSTTTSSIPQPTSSTSAGATTTPASSPARSASSTGSARDTIPAQGVRTLPAVTFGATAEFGSGVSARIARVEGVTTTTSLPGEVGGPSIAAIVTITNRSNRSVDVGSVVVDAADSTGAPAPSVSARPSRPFTGSVARGKSAAAIYVFSMATDRRRPVTVTVTYAAGVPVAKFVGNVG